MENKALVDLIRELGIEIKSHSSSLTDEQISLIKGHLKGTKSLVVEEQRIKSTVIRRRKKIVEVEPVIEPQEEEPILETQPEQEVPEEPPAVPEPKRPGVTVAEQEPPAETMAEPIIETQVTPVEEEKGEERRSANPCPFPSLPRLSLLRRRKKFRPR